MPSPHHHHHRKIKRYGWRRDELDERDLPFENFYRQATHFPTKFSLRPTSPSIYDQFQLGGCVGNGVARVVHLQRRKQKLTPDWVPSRLALYYWARAFDGTESIDAGAQIRNGIKAAAQFGAPDEALWPYDIDKFADEPSDAAKTNALLSQALKYYHIRQTINWYKTCLTQGFGIVYGFNVYQQFESEAAATTGIIELPKSRATPIGGHCEVITGWDDTKRANGVSGYWESANSWGDWGDSGYDWKPYSYLINTGLASDFWAVELMEVGT